MNVWLLSCLGVCLVGAWVPAGLTQGAFEDCCLAYHRPIPKLLLVRRATRVYYQPVSGSCNLQAVIFFMPRKAVCWNPRDPRLQEVLKILQNRGVQLKIPEKVLAALLSGTMKHHSGAPHVGNLVKTSSRNFSRPAMPSPKR